MMIKTFTDLKRPDWVLHEANSSEAALQLADLISPDFCTIDINMPGMLGTDAAEILLKKFPGIRVVIFSGNIQEESQNRAAELGAVFIAKPITESSVGQALRYFDPSI